MTITIPNKNNLSENQFKSGVLKLALIRVNCFNLGVDGTKLDQFFRRNYHTGLRDACRNLLYNCKFEYYKEELTIYFSNQWDTWARLITYGNGELKGIPVLRNLFI